MKNVILSTSMCACWQLKKEMHESSHITHFMSERFINKFTSPMISYFTIRSFQARFNTINNLNTIHMFMSFPSETLYIRFAWRKVFVPLPYLSCFTEESFSRGTARWNCQILPLANMLRQKRKIVSCNHRNLLFSCTRAIVRPSDLQR